MPRRRTSRRCKQSGSACRDDRRCGLHDRAADASYIAEAASGGPNRPAANPAVDAGQFARLGRIPTPWPAFVVARRNGFGRDRARRVLRVVDEAVTAFTTRPDAASLVAERIGIALDDAQAWLDRTQFAHGERLDPTTIETILERLRATGAA